MEGSIRKAASKVWQVLHKEGPVTAVQVAKLAGLSEALANQAIGWLACKGTLAQENRGSKVLLALKADLAKRRRSEEGEPSAIGPRIRQIREAMGLSTMALAPMVRLSQAQVSRLETGRQAFRTITLIRFARALGVEPQKLLLGDLVDAGEELERRGLAPSRVLRTAMADEPFLRFLERCSRVAKTHKKNLAKMTELLKRHF